MQDWLSYRLSDLILFSPRTYYRMFELYHEAIWPAQLVALGIVVVILVMLRRDDPWRGVVIAALLAACWLWVGIAFQLRRYATINWAARYFAVLFVVQAALLVWYGLVRRRLTFGRPGRTWVRPAAFVLAVVLPPLAGLAADRTLEQLELMGLTPDATSVATIGLLLVSSPPAPRALMLVPLCWCVIGGATLSALDSPEAWGSIGAGLVALIVMLWRLRPINGAPIAE